MLSTEDLPIVTPTTTRLLELRTTVAAAGREFIQLQILSADFVLTRVGNGTMLFLREGNRRYTVDPILRVLRPLDLGALWAANSDPARSRVAVSLHDGPVEKDGYPCRRLVIESQVGSVTLRTESFYTRISGVECTPLHDERVLSAPDGYPAHLLEPGEVLVSADTVVRQAELEQRQVSRLYSVRTDPEGSDAELEVLSFPVADPIA